MKKYDELLIAHAKYLSTMKDEAEEYVKTGSAESFYLIINDFPVMERMKEKLIKLLPKTKLEETLSKLRKYELEVYEILQDTELAKHFAEIVGFNLHYQHTATAVDSATKS